MQPLRSFVLALNGGCVTIKDVLDRPQRCVISKWWKIFDKQYQENTTSAPDSHYTYTRWVLNARSRDVPSGYNKRWNALNVQQHQTQELRGTLILFRWFSEVAFLQLWSPVTVKWMLDIKPTLQTCVQANMLWQESVQWCVCVCACAHGLCC